MSSTEFNVGLVNDRSSSRVLKPPGGGHSNIFGGYEEEKPRKMRLQNTEIKSCFQFDEPQTESQKIKDEQKKETDKKDQEEKKTEAVPQRVRVPPGGFSSGLW